LPFTCSSTPLRDVPLTKIRQLSIDWVVSSQQSLTGDVSPLPQTPPTTSGEQIALAIVSHQIH
jgi:hypothetical protein